MRNLATSRIPLGDVWFIVSAAQGVEYLLRPHGVTRVLNVVEAALPFQAWALWLLIPAVVGFIANRFKKWPVAIGCHMVSAAAYAGLTYGLIAGVVAANQTWGWQLAPAYALLFALHAFWVFVDIFRERILHLMSHPRDLPPGAAA
ncbi:hypothetical protein [Mycobacterium sp. SMC-4]|uniref:hypothetical protein n=1 Tax=Mycobacterium sp. SMC-4 TaxID=2857059 RepID=UPI0021B25DB0|nr:hypothetical protein [Mycobacterium sp. SMC-4]UXA19570.1 hypothetical protein KXD98_08210 [Mycobacterium sp. SMC-4]